MAFPTSFTAGAAWNESQSLATSVKNATNNMLAQGAISIRADQLLIYLNFLVGAVARFNTLAATGGLSAYAQAQVNNPSLSVSTEFATMISDINAVGSWITTNFPKDGSSNLLYVKFNGDGSLAYTSFTNAQLSGLITAMNTLVAQIN